MKPLDLNKVSAYVEKNINTFHDKKLEKIKGLTLTSVLRRKNPYLFKAKNIITAQDLVTSILDAFFSSGEETIFGEFLEALAIFVAGEVYDGKKSAAEGIDLELDKDGVKYIVSIKSGPNWGNSSQIKRMKDNFRKAQRILRTNNPTANIIAINGCCYGIDHKPDKGEYRKLCGQLFWEFISGNSNLYVDIIEPLGFKAREKNAAVNDEYAKIINRFTLEFMNNYCTDGEIQWDRLVKFNSGHN
jgi:hypothetical protein